MTSLKEYYQLTKPGIIYGNLLNAAGGFMLASRGNIDFLLLLTTHAGIAFVIASACVINNYIDRGIDKNMARTKKRSLVTGSISGQNAIIYGTVLGFLGFGLLLAFTNKLAVLTGVLGYISYLVLYGIGKRRTVHGTLIGSISGAMPPVAGYLAVKNDFDAGALIVFLILVFWQMPHFYAIAMYRFNDYKAAGLPVLPVIKGMRTAKIHIVFYTFMFVITSLLLTAFGYTGIIYLLVMTTVGLIWLIKGVNGFYAKDDTAWARKMFLFSLIVILVQSCMFAAGPILP